MSKVIKAAVTAAVVVFATVTILASGGTLAPLFTGAGWAASLGVAAQYALATFATTLISGAVGMMTSKGIDATSENFGTKLSNRNPIAPRQIIYGQARVGGTIVHMETSGTDNYLLHMVIAIAGHEVEELTSVRFGENTLTTTTSTINGSTVHTVTNADYTNTENDNNFGSGRLARFSFEDGSQTSVNGFMNAQLSSMGTSDKFLDVAYVYMQLVFDTEKFGGGIPQISFLVKGKKCYDPRTNNTVWTNNPALHIRDFLTDTQYGLKAETEEINEAAEPSLVGGWDLFSTAYEPEEEEIELTFVDDEDDGEVSMELDAPTEEETPFDAPAPAARDNHHGMVEAQAAPAMPEAMDAPIEEDETTFSLDDIDGDGFSLEIEEVDTPRAEDKEAPEERDYDPFEMSLSDMPELKAKADLEVVESSFTLPSTEFDMQPEASVDAVEVSTMEEDPDLKFEIKASEVVEELEEEADATVEQAMDQPISQLPKRAAQEVPNKIQERMNRLQKFGYRFKENLTEVERTPAYKRQGLDFDLEQKSAEMPSNLGVDSEGNIRTNNSFLHDNVD